MVPLASLNATGQAKEASNSAQTAPQAQATEEDVLPEPHQKTREHNPTPKKAEEEPNNNNNNKPKAENPLGKIIGDIPTERRWTTTIRKRRRKKRPT